jgi:hypothetical protein
MDYVHVDNLSADQLLEDDLIEINDEVVRIVAIAPTKEGIVVTFENEFGEKDILEFNDDAKFKFYIMQ